MSTHTERKAVEKLLTDYATALNSANTGLIPSFYTEDGLLMPQSFKDVTKGALLDRSESFFKQLRIQIDFDLPEVRIDGEYAFVQTIAKTISTSLENDQVEEQTSRDFFVLRKEKEEWKIFRYIFNNFIEE